MYISLNGELIDEKNAFVGVTGEGLNYGYGLFETMKLVDGKVFFLKEHMKRFRKSCDELNIEFHLDNYIISKYIEDLIQNNCIKSGGVKLLYTKDKNLVISTRKNNYTEDKYQKGFKICFSSKLKNQYSKLTYIKSINYLENVLAKDEACERGYNEAIFLNTHDKISEGTYTNLFFIKNNTIYTPNISCGLLPGIMREKVISLIGKLDLNLEIGYFSKEDLVKADEIFLTNSLMEIMPVGTLENIKFDLKQNSVTNLLKKEFHDLYY